MYSSCALKREPMHPIMALHRSTCKIKRYQRDQQSIRARSEPKPLSSVMSPLLFISSIIAILLIQSTAFGTYFIHGSKRPDEKRQSPPTSVEGIQFDYVQAYEGGGGHIRSASFMLTKMPNDWALGFEMATPPDMLERWERYVDKVRLGCIDNTQPTEDQRKQENFARDFPYKLRGMIELPPRYVNIYQQVIECKMAIDFEYSPYVTDVMLEELKVFMYLSAWRRQ